MVASERRRRCCGARLGTAALATLASVVLGAVLTACTPPAPSAGGPLSSATGSPPSSTASGPATAPASPTTTPGEVPVRTSLTVTTSATAVREGSPVTLRVTLLGLDAPVSGATVSVAHAGVATELVLDATGTGSLVLDSLPAGRQDLLVSYPGDATHAPSSGSATVTVAALTSVVLAASPTTIAPGTPAPVEITVTSKGVAVPGAVVTVTHAGKSVAAPATNASGKATVLLTDLPGGPTTITASYRGDALHAPATGTLGLTVHADSVIVVTASDLRPTAGKPVTIGWTVTSAGKPLPGAPVTVSAGGKITRATSGKDGRGSTELSGLAPGSVPVTVAYAGDAGHGAVTGAITLAVVGSTDVDVRVSDDSVASDDALTVSFDVTSTGGAVTGAATVRYAGTSRQVKLNASGHGSLTIPAGTLPTGMHTIEVDYAGSPSYAASSGSIDVSVADNPACPAWARACVDLTHNVSWLQSNGTITYGPVPISSGRPGYRTPSGSYQIYWKDKNHRSSLFNNAPMPNSLFFNGGIAFHEGDPDVMSHGCIHLTWSASQKYWDYLRNGDTVVVFGYARY